MDSHVIEEFHEIWARLDVMISFTIIRFVYGVCLSLLTNVEIVLLGVIVSIVFSSALQMRDLTTASRTVSELTRKIALLVVSQATISVMGVSQGAKYTSESPMQYVLQSMTVVTCMLILTAVIPQDYQHSEMVQRCITLLLYIYADATESLFNYIEDGIVPTMLCLLLYVLLHQYSTSMKAHPSLSYLMRAANMVSINLILRALTSLSQQSTSLNVQTILYFIVLFIIHTVSCVSSIFNETRDYALWKVSQQLFMVYRSYDLDLVVSIPGSIVLLATRDTWSANNTALVFQLVVLVVVSIVLDAASGFIQNSHSMDKSVMLFAYVVVIHRISASLAHQ